MPHIVIGAHVNHLVDMACLTEFQKLENLIYLETGAQLIIAIVSTISWIGKMSTLQGEEKAYPDQGSQAATVENVYQGRAWKATYPC